MSDSLDDLAAEILSARKYRQLELDVRTVRSLLEQELPRHRSRKEALDAVRRKLHNIVADYLGDPDYPAAEGSLTEAFAAGDPQAVRQACAAILETHSSTRERMPILESFYQRLWQVTGVPGTIFDLACGLNPFALPWMELPATARYHAFDLVGRRVKLINHFLRLAGREQLAQVGDILVSPPAGEADVALFFKEAHRFEQRRPGCNRAFWQAIRARWLLVSLPVESLSGRHSLLEGHRRLVHNAISGLGWELSEVEFPGEMVWCIEKRE